MLLVVVSAYASVIYLWPLIRGGASEEEVLTAVAGRGDLVMTIVNDGELESVKSETVVCEVEGGGKIATILPEGVMVKKGDLVVQLDTDALLKSINAQQVRWEQAVSKVKTAESELEVQKNKSESEIAKAELALTLAKIDYESYEEGEYQVEHEKRLSALELGKKELKEAEDNLIFTRNLVKKGLQQAEQLRAMELNVEAKRYAVSQQETDLMVLRRFTKLRKQTELEAKAQDAERELARTKKSQEAALQKAESELISAKSTAEVEKQELDRLQTQLAKCSIHAKNDGIVLYVNRYRWDTESRVRPGVQLYYQQPIFTIPDLDDLQVKVKIHESTIKRVRVGQPATIELSALPGKILQGKVKLVATVAAEDSWLTTAKEYETTVSIDNLPQDAGLRPGMSASVKIMLGVVKDAVTVPLQAVSEVHGKHVCYVMEEGKIEQREVEVGESNVQFIEIQKGLEPGERVALDARKRAAAAMKASGPDASGDTAFSTTDQTETASQSETPSQPETENQSKTAASPDAPAEKPADPPTGAKDEEKPSDDAAPLNPPSDETQTSPAESSNTSNETPSP